MSSFRSAMACFRILYTCSICCLVLRWREFWEVQLRLCVTKGWIKCVSVSVYFLRRLNRSYGLFWILLWKVPTSFEKRWPALLFKRGFLSVTGDQAGSIQRRYNCKSVGGSEVYTWWSNLRFSFEISRFVFANLTMFLLVLFLEIVIACGNVC